MPGDCISLRVHTPPEKVLKPEKHPKTPSEGRCFNHFGPLGYDFWIFWKGLEVDRQP